MLKASLSLATTLPWASWRPATCLPDDCFCEALGEGLIRQPANTWSSFAFVGVAFWVLFRVARAGRPETLSRAETALFIGSLFAIGLGSAFYHASLTFVGQVLDVSGMYLIATFMLLHRLGPRWKLPPIAAVLAFVLLNAALMAAQITTPSARRIAFGVLLVTALLVEWGMGDAGRRFLGIGAFLMVVAFGIWVLDRKRLLCDPASPFQGHSVWHILGALAASCLWLSYEDRLRESPQAASRTACLSSGPIREALFFRAASRAGRWLSAHAHTASRG